MTNICRSILILTAFVAAASVDAGSPAGVPISVGKLDASKTDLGRPRLFLNAQQAEGARARAKSDPFARGIFDRAIAEADKHLSAKLDTVVRLDETWWDKAKLKRWEDTYPEVFLNTSVIPNRYAEPAATLAMAWQLTGKDAYAERAVGLLMILAEYSFAAEHFDVGMNYAIFGINVLKAYDLLAVRLTADQRASLDAFMTRLAAAVAKNDAYWIENNVGGGINNHLAWHKMMLGLLGLFYDRPDMVDYCLNGPRGLVPLLADGLVDNGLWRESSLVYQFAAVTPMLVIADCQQRMGRRPGLHEITAANGRTLKQSFDAMFDVLAPDGLIPPIGDAYGSRKKLWDVPAYEYCWNLWRDNRYAWLIGQHQDPTAYLLYAQPLPAKAAAPPIGSILLPEHGYAFLRSHRDGQYWQNPDARCVMLTYDRSSVHANADKLSLMLFGLNRMLVSDVEGKATVPHAFSSRIQRELNRGGLCQNTVMIDGADQRCSPEMLDLVEYRDLDEEKRVTAADRRGILYDGVRQMRTIAMTPDYLLDVFQVDCGTRQRQIDWIVHVMDERAAASAESNPLVSQCEPFSLPKTVAYSWLREPRSVRLAGSALSAGGTIGLDWRDGRSRLGLRMLNLDVERLIFCGFPLDDTPKAPSIPMLIVRKQAIRATFAAVWLVGDRVSDVVIERRPDREGNLVFTVEANGNTRRHLVPKL